MRDVANGDLVAWIDKQLELADQFGARDRARRLRDAVVQPLRHIYGVSDKLLNMSLASLLLAGDPKRERWIAAGTAMIACDSLVHNFFWRSGLLLRLNAVHPYGPQCYKKNGCVAIIEQVARRIDARAFNPDFPRRFDRFVQKSIWRLCAADELNVCNGNRIDDTKRCEQKGCRLYSCCDRVALNSRKQ
jgi:hypothetical protein